MHQNEALARKSLDLMRADKGQKEATGRNDGPFVDALEKHFGLHHEAWCAMETTWCIERAGAMLGIVPFLHKSASSTEIYNQAKMKGLLLSRPMPGCIGLLKGNGGTPGKSHHHTFRVETIEGAVVHSIDGNWTNAVVETTHPISACDFVAVS